MATDDRVIQNTDSVVGQAIAEDVYLAERYAVALRFHGQSERAEDYERWANDERSRILETQDSEASQ